MQVKTPANDAIPLTFSIVAKIYLPKKVSESVSRLLIKWLKEKYSSQIFSQNMTKLIENNKIVYDSWQVVLERKQIQQVLQFQTIYSIVSLFEMNKVPRQFLFSYFSMIIKSANEGTSKNSFFTKILSLNLTKTYGIPIQKIMQHAFKLYDILPKKKQIYIMKPTEFLVSDNDTEEPPQELPPQPFIPLTQAKRISASYIKAQVDPSNCVATFLENNTFKSVASGSEGQLNEHVSESIRFISELQIHMYTVFETLVRADQLYRAVLYRGTLPGILLQNAATFLYGQYGKEILSYPYEVIEPIILEHCKHYIKEVFDQRCQTSNHVDLMTNHMPKFDYSPTISFSTQKQPYKFKFSARSKLVADILSRIGHIHSQNFVYFLDTLMPLFVLTQDGEQICVIGTDTICNALYLFSRCALAIDEFFSSGYPENPSLNDIIRAAECQASLKYSSVTNTLIEDFVEDFLKKFFANDYKFYEFVEEAQTRFGFASKSLFTLVMYITQLDALCSRFAAQSKLDEFGHLAKFFSRARGENAEKSLKARFQPYKMKVQKLLISPLVKIEMKYGDQQAVVTPI